MAQRRGGNLVIGCCRLRPVVVTSPRWATRGSRDHLDNETTDLLVLGDNHNHNQTLLPFSMLALSDHRGYSPQYASDFLFKHHTENRKVLQWVYQ